MPTDLGIPSAGQRQTLAARQAFSERFTTPEARSAYFRELGRRSAAGRVVLSASEAATLAGAYEILGQIAERTQQAEGGAL